MIKQFSAGDISVRPFKAFKNWRVQSVTSGSTDSYGFNTYYDSVGEVNRGLKLDTFFYPSGSNHYTASLEPINHSGKYYRNVYSLTDAMFYRNKDNFLELFGVESLVTDKVSGKKEVRNIGDKVVTLALNQSVFGEKIRPYTVDITDNSNPHATYHILDDGYTNLYITGSHFSTYTNLSATRHVYPRAYWDTSSGQFYLNYLDGTTKELTIQEAKEYSEIGMNVSYTGTPQYLYDTSSVSDKFYSENEHFGEAVSSWYKYVAVGSSIDKYSLNRNASGYASLFKYDDVSGIHRLVKTFTCPLSESGDFDDMDVDHTFPYSDADLQGSSSYFADTFGQSVCVRDNFLVIGSSSGSVCFGSGSYPGFVFVYDKYKGGTDDWGLINILEGGTDEDKFGYSVVVDKDIIAVGAPNVSGSGAVYIYRRKMYLGSGCDSIDIPSFWQTVSPQNDYCEDIIAESGSLSVYSERTIGSASWSGSYTWVYEATITSSVLASGDNFGWSISLDSGNLLVGTNKTGNGYASLFTCSYYSASLGECPTASWSEHKMFRRDTTYGDLDMGSQLYANDVTAASISSDGFGNSVSIREKNIAITCPRDKAFIPYATYAGSPSVLGSVYFYRYMYMCDAFDYWKLFKSFGNRQYSYNNNFGKSVSLGGGYAAVASWSDKVGRSVDYVDGQYVLEDYGYAATSSEDPNGVLGRVTLYKYDDVVENWELAGMMRRNKEANAPASIFGYSVCLCSDFMAIGAPVVNFATASATASIYDPNNLVDFPSNYSGSVFVYNMSNLEENPLIGNVFYKNGYFAVTSTASNYENIFTGTGSAGFDMSYMGSHTIYEHEYLCSIKPGEFNYSANPSALVKLPLAFDVNQDGVFDFLDVDLIMRYLQKRRFFEEFVFDDSGLILEQNSSADYSWWGDDLIKLESNDVLLQEKLDEGYIASSSFNAFTRTVFSYIEENLVNTGILDIDGDGKINMNDGNILALYYFNQLVPENLQSLLSTDSTRIYVADIIEYLNKYCKENVDKILPYFLEYQYSSSYDPTGSYLAPFITTIGLYQGNELVAVGKLGRPVKNLIDWPLNIVVRFDT